MSMLHDIANVNSYINIGSLKYNNNKIDGSINTSYYYYGHVGLCHNFIVALRHLIDKNTTEYIYLLSSRKNYHHNFVIWFIT